VNQFQPPKRTRPERREKKGINPWTIIGWLFVIGILAILAIFTCAGVGSFWILNEAANQGAGR